MSRSIPLQDERAEHDAALIARMQAVIRGLLPLAIKGWPRMEPANGTVIEDADEMVAAWDRYDAEMARRQAK